MQNRVREALKLQFIDMCIRTKHPMGCPAVRYHCTTTHRRVMSLVDALLSSPFSNPG